MKFIQYLLLKNKKYKVLLIATINKRYSEVNLSFKLADMIKMHKNLT